MKFTLDINCDTPAFTHDARVEVGSILVSAIADFVVHDQVRAGTLHDHHGAMVGHYEFLPADLL